MSTKNIYQNYLYFYFFILKTFIQTNNKARLRKLLMDQKSQQREDFKTHYKQTKGMSVFDEAYKKSCLTQNFWLDDLIESYFRPKDTFPVLMIDAPLYNLMNMNACLMYSHNLLKNTVNEVQDSDEGKSALIIAQKLYVSDYSGERELKGIPDNLSYGRGTAGDFYEFIKGNAAENKLMYVDEYGEDRRIDTSSPFFSVLRSAKIEQDSYEELVKARDVTNFTEVEHALKLNSRKFLKGLSKKLQELTVSLLDEGGKDYLDNTWQDIFSQDLPAKMGAEDMCCDLLLPLSLDMESLDRLYNVEGHKLVPSIVFDIEYRETTYKEAYRKDGIRKTGLVIDKKEHYLVNGYTQVDYKKVSEGIWQKVESNFNAETNIIGKATITFVDSQDNTLGTDYSTVLASQPVQSGIKYLHEVLQGKKGFSNYIFDIEEDGEKYQGYYESEDQEAIHKLDNILTTPISDDKPDKLLVFNNPQACKEAIEYLSRYFGITEDDDSKTDKARLESMLTKVLDKFEVKDQVQKQVDKLKGKVRSDIKAFITKKGFNVADFEEKIAKYKQHAERQVRNTIDSLVGAITPNQHLTMELAQSSHQSYMVKRYKDHSGISTIFYHDTDAIEYEESLLSVQVEVAHANRHEEITFSSKVGNQELSPKAKVKGKISRADAELIEKTDVRYKGNTPFGEYDTILEGLASNQFKLNDAYHTKATEILDGQQVTYSHIKVDKDGFLTELGIEIDSTESGKSKIESTTNTLEVYRKKKFGQQLFGLGNVAFSAYSIGDILSKKENLTAQDIASITKTTGDIIQLGLEQRHILIQKARSEIIAQSKAVNALSKSILRESYKLTDESLTNAMTPLNTQNKKLSNLRKVYYKDKASSEKLIKNFKVFNTAIGGSASLLSLANNAVCYMDSLKRNDKNLQASYAYGMASEMAALTSIAYETTLSIVGKQEAQQKARAFVLKMLAKETTKAGAGTAASLLEDRAAEAAAREALSQSVKRKFIIEGVSHLAGYAVPIIGWALFIADIGFAVYSYVKWSNRDTKFIAFIKASQFCQGSIVDKDNRNALFNSSSEQYTALLSLYNEVRFNQQDTTKDKGISVNINLPTISDDIHTDIKIYICARNYMAYSFSANTDELLLLNADSLLKRTYTLNKPDKLSVEYRVEASQKELHALVVEMVAKEVKAGVYSEDEIGKATETTSQGLCNGWSHDKNVQGDESDETYKHYQGFKTPYHLMVLARVTDNEGNLLTNDYMRKIVEFDEDQLRIDDKYMNLIDRNYESYGEIFDIMAFEDSLVFERTLDGMGFKDKYSKIKQFIADYAKDTIINRDMNSTGNMLHIFKPDGDLDKSYSDSLIRKTNKLNAVVIKE